LDLAVITLMLLGLVVSSAICIFLRNLIKAAIAMAASSAILSVIMFLLHAPLAGAIELSVCAGLIPVIFISTISMTRIRSKEEIEEEQKARRKRFIFLPVLLVVIFAATLFVLWPLIDSSIPLVAASSGEKVQDIFWDKRKVDLLGQITIILAGVFGVIVFFKESAEK
jgi:NADH:ubiquinone oxidoreductase subunit 6 (subunit J)